MKLIRTLPIMLYTTSRQRSTVTSNPSGTTDSVQTREDNIVLVTWALSQVTYILVDVELTKQSYKCSALCTVDRFRLHHVVESIPPTFIWFDARSTFNNLSSYLHLPIQAQTYRAAVSPMSVGCPVTS